MLIPLLLATAGVASAGKSLLNRAAPSLPAGWASDGCYSDNASPNRSLPSKLITDNSMTIDKCVAACNTAGYTYAGAEAGNECHCANSISGAKVGAGDCGTPCKGGQGQTCGGGWRLSVYKKSAPPAAIPSGWTAAGCYTDSWSRTLASYSYSSNTLKPETCINDCAAKGYTYAGLEAGNECYCSNALTPSDSPAKVGDSECGTPCTGNGSQICGGGWRLTVYQSAGATTTPPPTDPSSAGWTSEGCYTDGQTRTLTGSTSSSTSQTVAACQTKCANYKYAGLEAGNECYCSNSIGGNGQKVGSGDCSTPCTGSSSTKCGGGWRVQIYSHTPAGPTAPSTGSFTKSGCYSDSSSNRVLRGSYPSVASTNSIETCINACSAGGFGYAGVEWGQECFCGDVLYNPTKVDDSECQVMACSGNSAEKCGNGNRILIYEDQDGWCS